MNTQTINFKNLIVLTQRILPKFTLGALGVAYWTTIAFQTHVRPCLKLGYRVSSSVKLCTVKHPSDNNHQNYISEANVLLYLQQF